MPAAAELPDVSVLVIGRNEGPRLPRCLASVQAADWQGLRHELVYVDSDSQDDSVQQASAAGARVLGLGSARPSAAAARNIGLHAARAPLVLMLDGDTELAPGFVPQALAALAEDPQRVAVWGHRRESNPGQSIYTRVLDLDWVFACGPTPYFGGDVLARRQPLLDAGAFDASLVAGEEPDLCHRLRQRGWTIAHIDAPMTRHDLAITSLHGWWLRAERAGLAYAQVSVRHAASADPLWHEAARRNRWQAAGLLALPPLLLAAALWQPLLALALAAGLAGRLARSVWRCRWKCPGQPALACAYALHSQLQQLPIALGQARWWRLQRRGQAPRLIEYPRAGAGIAAPRPGGTR